MPFVLNDRVLEISTTTGTVPFVLGGPPSGYQSFLSGIGGSNTTFYAAFNTVANEWELGLGTLNAGATELTRTTIYSSSNSNLAVNFSAGTKNVFVALPSSQTLTANQSNTFTAAQIFRAANAVRSEAAATQDAVVLAGRAGGTSSYAVSLTPTTLSASRTVTLPDASTTLPIATQEITFSGPTAARTYTLPDSNSTLAALGTAQTFTAIQTFRSPFAIRSEAASGQDAIVIAGRAGGTGGFSVRLQPTTLVSDTVLTLPNVNDTVATVGTAQTFTAAQTFRAANAVRSEAAATQDAVVLAGRAGGTGSFAVTLTPTTLSASRTLTLPNVTDTVATIGTAQTFTAAQTFRAANAIRSEAASTQDALVVAGRAGGTGSFAITLTPDTLAASRTYTFSDPGENVTVGYLNIPQNSESADYTLVASDAGKHIFHPSADTTPRTFTIPANGTVPYAIGTTITFINQNGAGAVTIAITSDTMRLAGSGATGSRTLAANGIATCVKVTSTEWLISGTGLT